MKVIVYDDAGEVCFQFSHDISELKVAPALAESQQVSLLLRACADIVDATWPKRERWF